jgi:hypothetical protein
VLAAAGFIGFLSTNQNDRVIVSGGLTVHETLSAAGLFTTDDTDRVEFGHFFCDAHQLRYWAERFSTKVGIQSRQDNTHSSGCELFDDFNDCLVKKLNLVHSDDGGRRLEVRHDVLRTIHRQCVDILTGMAGDMLDTVAVINAWLENLYFLFGYHGAPRPADQFFSLAAKHAATDDFNPPGMMYHASP